MSLLNLQPQVISLGAEHTRKTWWSVRRVIKEMNRLYIALVLAVATASVASNEELEVPAVPGVAELGDCELGDEVACSMDTVPESRANLHLGAAGINDRRLAWITHRVPASDFLIHDQEVTFRGPQYTNITHIRATMIGNTQHARPTVIAGGLWHDFVTLRILGARGFGFDYNIYIYATINCSNS
ncbi:hypothetical protein PYW07_009511 [Mythimna separata]|uniref:Uncharacterized protein n=1 Tax=Mythimna separata TaxID=271217 RepID=A0AAD7YCD9_MYTSE|nr:hypothetical protein PYW07_009511 [Mythimna separata]